MYKNRKIVVIKMLIVFMAFIVTLLWAKILIFKSPESAAAVDNQLIPAVQSNSNVSKVQQSIPGGYNGRANITDKNKQAKDVNYEQYVDYTDAFNQTDGMIEKVQAHLNLQAIVLGNSPQAFINDSLYKTGDKINISDGNLNCECVIEKISELEVLINCFGTEISLKIANPDEVIDNQ